MFVFLADAPTSHTLPWCVSVTTVLSRRGCQAFRGQLCAAEARQLCLTPPPPDIKGLGGFRRWGHGEQDSLSVGSL